MGRAGSPLTYTTSTGKTYGIEFTERDGELIRQIVRWYAITARQLYRTMHATEKQLWHPAFGSPPADELYVRGADAWNGTQRLRERLGKYRILDAKPQVGIGPFVDSEWISRTQEAWFALPLGARAAGVEPWVTKKFINGLFVQHADAAASIGCQLESYGYRVASERELRRNLLIDGTDLSADFGSEFTPPGGGKTVIKHPDIAVLAPDGDTYIAVEVERAKYRSVDTYVDKLMAYRRNKFITAVWYICADENTRERVIRACEKVFADAPHARVRVKVADQSHGFWHMPRFSPDDNADRVYDPQYADDLTALMTLGRGRRGILDAS